MSDFLDDKRLLRLKIMSPKKMLQSSNQRSGRTWAITWNSENLGKVTRLRLVAIPRLCHTRWAILTDHGSLNTKNEANRPLRKWPIGFVFVVQLCLWRSNISNWNTRKSDPSKKGINTHLTSDNNIFTKQFSYPENGQNQPLRTPKFYTKSWF